MEDNRFKLTKTDLTKVGKGVLVAVAGAVLTYLSEWAANTDFGDWPPVIVAGLSIMANIVRKWSTPTKQE